MLSYIKGHVRWSEEMRRENVGRVGSLRGHSGITKEHSDLVGSNHCQVQPIALKIDNCHFHSQVLDIIRMGENGLAQCLIEWAMRSWCWWPDLPVGQHNKVAMSGPCYKPVSILI